MSSKKKFKLDMGKLYKEYGKHRRITPIVKDMLIEHAKQLEKEVVRKREWK